jgi:hypothetical protein
MNLEPMYRNRKHADKYDDYYIEKWGKIGNSKRNLHHHSTAVRLKRRRQRRAKALRKEGALNVRGGARRIEYNVEGFRF